MKYEVGDLVFISDTRSLYRITRVYEQDKKYDITWIGTGDKNVPQYSPTYEDVLKFFKRPTKLEKALL